MAGSMELGFPKTSACSLREQAARSILRNVRAKGHSYVELREDGKKFIFFCTLCLAPCYSDSVLFDHLKGNLHTERLSAAKITLLKANPWPFNDGVLFFDNSADKDKISNGHSKSLIVFHNNDKNLATVNYGENLKANGNGHVQLGGFHSNEDADLGGGHSDCEIGTHYKNLNGDRGDGNVVIPGVLVKDEISNLEVRLIGLGQIAARFHERDGVSNGISRIWCEWLGENGLGNGDNSKVPEHDFAIVIFSYNYDLGRKGLFDEIRLLLPSSPLAEVEGTRKRKKSFSDPEDISESLSNQYGSSGEDSPASSSSTSRLLLDRCNDQLLDTRFISSKTVRRELRRQQRVAAERMCDICQHKMLPGKHVAALVNVKTGKLVCSSRNVNGAFHVFHTSCLVHWILLCELETYINQLGAPKPKRRSRRKSKGKSSEIRKEGEMKATRKQIYCVFCPECQGTGVNIDGDELEEPTIPLSEMFKFKIKVSDARRAWMKSPEVLHNCSTGFHFPSQSDETVQEKVSALKLLRFFAAVE